MTKSPDTAEAETSTALSRTPRTAYLIGRLDRALRRHIADAVGPLGLTTQQYTALSVLHAKGRLSNARLAQRSFISPQAANELVKTLETKGLICRERNPAHGRIIWIKLTKEGERVLLECEAAVDRLEQIMLQELSPEERDQLSAYLSACARALGTGSMEL